MGKGLSLLGLLLVSACAGAETGYSTWVTQMSCGSIKAKYSVDCKKATSETELNSCKAGQRLEFEGTTKKLSVPDYSPKELKEYQATHTADRMFPIYWSCVMAEGKPYLRIQYTADVGENDGGEKVEFYGTDRSRVVNAKFEDKLDQAYLKDGSSSKDHHIKATHSE
jgi:hypothetical protein